MRFREEGGAQRAREGLLGRAVGGVGVAQLCGSGVELKVLEGQSVKLSSYIMYHNSLKYIHNMYI